jgi:hypothetical protein
MEYDGYHGYGNTTPDMITTVCSSLNQVVALV